MTSSVYERIKPNGSKVSTFGRVSTMYCSIFDLKADDSRMSDMLMTTCTSTIAYATSSHSFFSMQWYAPALSMRALVGTLSTLERNWL